MSEPSVAEVTEDLSKAKVSDEAGLYTSDSKGSDEAGEGTYKVPFKTVMKVRLWFNLSSLYPISFSFFRL